MSITLEGSIECRLDSKGRVLFPAVFREQLSSVIDNGFVLKRSMQRKCVELYPSPEWAKMKKGLSKLNRFNKKQNDFIRIFMAGVRQVSLDSAGRLQIPKDLTTFAGLGSDIVMASTAGIIEIWNKSMYEATLDEYTDDDQGNLAEEVFGVMDLNEE